MSHFIEENQRFMNEALTQAKLALPLGEVPVGALLIRQGKVLSRAHNYRETEQNPIAHAEILAIQKAAKLLGTWRLEDTALYVTLEPCPMCWGAILQARIPQVYFGAKDPKAGVCGSLLSLHEFKKFNHHPQVQGGILAQECGQVLSDFFTELRAEKKTLAQG